MMIQSLKGTLLALPLLGALLLGGCSVQPIGQATLPPTPAPTVTATATTTAGIAAKGTLTGTVTASPTCPVQTEPPSCPPKPVTGRTVTILTLSGQSVATTMTDEHGAFSISLSPGTYRVEATITPGTIGMRQVAPVQAVIVAGTTVHVDIVLDTGIR